MRDTSLRWGLGMGVLSAAIGTGALLLGAVIEPIKTFTTPDAVVVAVFVRGMLVLVSLGLAFGFAYYAGLRVARAYFHALKTGDSGDSGGASEGATNSAIASLFGSTVLGTSLNRRYTVWAGGLTMLCFWLITSMYIFVLPPTPDQSTAPKNDILNFIETRLLLGVIYVVFGLGLGGLGGRAPAARLLLDRIALPRPPAALRLAPTPSLQAEPDQPAMEPAQSPAEVASPFVGAPIEPASESPASAPSVELDPAAEGRA